MSRYINTMNGDNVECPYCGYTYQPEAENYSEDERPKECDECGKQYRLYQSFSVTHCAEPDCGLNGEQHDYQPIKLRDGGEHPFCTVCGKCQPLGELTEAVF